MFDIGWGELVLIGLIALIVIGPKELPTVMRTIGQWSGKIKRMASEFQGQFQEALRESELADLQKHAEDLKSSLNDITDFDPTADTPTKPTEPTEPELAAEPAEPDRIEAGETETASNGADTDAAPPPELAPPAQAADDTPLPEPSAPVSHENLPPIEPPPKPAGGTA